MCFRKLILKNGANFLDAVPKIAYDKRKGNAQGKERIDIMILKLKKSVRKQAKCVHKESEKLFKKLRDKGSSATFDTNDVLLRMDRITDELNTLRDVINQEKEQTYLERMGAVSRQKPRISSK